MCSVCMSNPCNSRCPNAEEEKTVHICMNCGEDIYEGDDYYDIDGEAWCEECIKDCKKTAELND